METNLEFDPHWRLHMAISAFSARCTFVVMIIFAASSPAAHGSSCC
ncbi:MAG: hypothetical protein U0694_00850 [Anaerolineae bacterium]